MVIKNNWTRSLIVVFISIMGCFITIRLDIVFTRTTVLFSLIFSFPLVFTLQEAFKKRERALIFLSDFKAAIEVAYESFNQAKKITTEMKLEVKDIFRGISVALFLFLKNEEVGAGEIHEQMKKLFQFMRVHAPDISSSVNMRILRHIENLYRSLMNLISLREHGSIITLRYISTLCVYTFPLLQAPMLYGIFGKKESPWMIYLLSIICALAVNLIYNIRLRLENPFDQDGGDDIQLQLFEFEPVEIEPVAPPSQTL